MGIYLIEIIPKDIIYIPTANEQKKITQFLERYKVQENQIEHKISNSIQCHVNPYGREEIDCPNCDQVITTDWIYHLLGELYDSNIKGFHLQDLQLPRKIPCCQRRIPLTNFNETIAFSIYSAKYENNEVWNLIDDSCLDDVNKELSQFIGFNAEIILIRM